MHKNINTIDKFTIDPHYADRDFFAEEYRVPLSHETVVKLGERAITPELHDTIKPYTEYGAATVSEKPVSDDNFIAGENFAAVCDGVGSSKYGGRASKLVTELLAEQLPAVNELTDRKAAKEYVKRLLKDAHQLVLNEQSESGLSMASTATTLNYIVVEGETYAVIGNVGDSPVYLMRDGEVGEITNWHRDTLPKPANRPALGKPLAIEPVVRFVKVQRGDMFVLTSNGVRKRDPSGKKLRTVAARHHNPQKIANILTSLDGPSHDDCTAVVSRCKRTANDTVSRHLDRELIAA